MRTIVCCLALSVAIGCAKEAKSPDNRPAAEAASKKSGDDDHGGHAAAGVVPGSHEDWCGEHAVPESQCTQCNTDLIAAYKATGDWCAEHGLPESHCLKCNPELKIVRPPKPEGK